MRKSAIILFIILVVMVISSCDGMRDAVADSYVITFHRNPPDGSKDKTQKVEIKEGKKLPDAEKDFKWSYDSYKFDGWATRKGNKREKALDRTDLYAQWKAAD